MKPTEEQLAVIQCQAPQLIVKACAGSGKTSTLIKFAEFRPNESMLYLAFNRAIRDEARRKFPRNTRCETTHGLAYAKFGKYFSGKLGNPKAYHLSSALDITIMQAGLVLNTVTTWLCSADPVITDKHVKDGRGSEAEIVTLANKAWGLMQDTGKRDVPMPHDGYLKLYQLSGSQINVDYILFDEYQDSNAVTQAIVDNQRCKKIYVGDSRQSIYAFRGAVNTMETSNVKTQLSLTNSFRFGDGVAAFANAVLGEHQAHEDIIQGKGRYRTTFNVDRDYPHTVLCRTNGNLFMEAVHALKHKKPFGFVGGVANYKFDIVLDAYWLKKGKRGSIKDKMIAAFAGFEEMIAYAESLDDRELKFLARAVKEYGDDIPSLVEQIKKKAIDTFTGNEIIMTTAHRAKGLEWLDVVLTDDFTDMRASFDPVTKQTLPPDIQEINLLYVAATRAQRGLRLPETLLSWLAESNPDLAKMVRTRDKAENVALPSLGGEAPLETSTKSKAESTASTSDAKRFREGLLELITSGGKSSKVDLFKGLKLSDAMADLSDQFAEEAAGCAKGNPKRAGQLALASGLIAAILEGDFVLNARKA